MATLGSCAFFWKTSGLFGLAHYRLPEPRQLASGIRAKYVTQALPSLLTLLKIKPQDCADIEAVVVGANNMMNS